MCTVSMVMDHYYEKWYPVVYPTQTPNVTIAVTGEPPITDEEIREFRKLLERAREYDRRMNQPDCEMAEKKDALKKLAKALGVDISFIDEAE